VIPEETNLSFLYFLCRTIPEKYFNIIIPPQTTPLHFQATHRIMFITTSVAKVMHTVGTKIKQRVNTITWF
jgi:hypothetical protein